MFRKIVEGTSSFTMTKIVPGQPDVIAVEEGYPYLLDGTVQSINEPNRPNLETHMPIKTRRIRRDPLGNILKRVKAPRKRGSRLQPYKMNPVLIQRAVSTCPYSSGKFLAGRPYPYECEVKGRVATSTWQCIWALNNDAAWPVDAVTRDRAVIACLEKLSSPKNLDAGVGLAEIGQTIKFLRSPLKSLTKLTGKFHRKTESVLRRRRATPREVAQATADTWLEYRYAFNPLVSDVTGVMIEVSEKYCTSSSILRRVSGRASTEKFFPPEKYIPEYPYDLVRSHRKGVVNKYQKQTITAVQLYRYRPFFEDAIRLASLGLSPVQLPSFVWETTGFSFIADWAVDVGSWLRAWELRPHIEILDACCSSVTQTRVNVSDVEMGFYNYVKFPSGSVDVLQLNRWLTVLQPPTLPMVTKEALNLFRSLDSLSLLWKPTTQLLQNLFKRGK